MSFGPRGRAEEEEFMAGVHVVCAACGQVNRVAQDRPADRARCGRCGETLFDGHPSEIDAAGLDRQIERSGVPLVVDFWAGWCGPCRAMAPAFAHAAAALEPKAKFLKIDVDAHPQAAAKFGVRGIPALFVLRDGKVVAQRAGAMDAASLERWVREAAAIGG
jgi:thioredoxin 2